MTPVNTANTQITIDSGSNPDQLKTITQVEENTKGYFTRWDHLKGTQIRGRNTALASLAAATIFGGMTVLAVPALGVTVGLTLAVGSFIVAGATTGAAISLCKRSAKPVKSEDLLAIYQGVHTHNHQLAESLKNAGSEIHDLNKQELPYLEGGEKYNDLQNEKTEATTRMNREFAKANREYMMTFDQLTNTLNTTLLLINLNPPRSVTTNTRETERTPLLQTSEELSDSPEMRLITAVQRFQNEGANDSTKAELKDVLIHYYSQRKLFYMHEAYSICNQIDGVRNKPNKRNFYHAGPLEQAHTEISINKMKADWHLKNLEKQQNQLGNTYNYAIAQAGNSMSPDLEAFAKEIPK